MKPFQYTILKKPKGVSLDTPRPAEERPPAEEMQLIQGKIPRSLPEWRVAVALWGLGVRFEYQVPIFGGTSVRGGLILDFLLLEPFPTPLLVHGEYWHESELDPIERMNIAKIEQHYQTKAILVWDWELQDQDMANETIRRKVKR